MAVNIRRASHRVRLARFGLNEGPIISMIENYTSRLMWNVFMRIPSVVAGLRRARDCGLTLPVGARIGAPTASAGSARCRTSLNGVDCLREGVEHSRAP